MFFHRAIKYVIRKKSRTCILLLVLATINVLNMTMVSIRENTIRMQNEIKRNTQPKIILEPTRGNIFSTEDIIFIKQRSGVESINKISLQYAYPGKFHNFKGKEEERPREEMVTLYGYDDLSRDSRFSELEMKLVEGESINIKSKNAVVVNRKLAYDNSLDIGDQISFKKEGKDVEGTICGIYDSSIQDKQPDTMVSFYRIENIIFVSQDIALGLDSKETYSKIVLYLTDPEKMQDVERQVERYFGERVDISISDSMYKKVQIQLRQIRRISNLILWSIVFISICVVTLLYSIWIRDRKKEIGILLSLGCTKRNIFCQIISESETLLILSTVIGSFASGKIANLLLSAFNEVQVSRINMDIDIDVGLAVRVFGIETAIVMTAILFAVSHLFFKSPKQILSEMED